MERGDDTPAVVNKPARIGGMFDERFAGDLSNHSGPTSANPLHNFCFSLLFLMRGSHRVGAPPKAERYGRLGTYRATLKGLERVLPG